MESIEPPTRWKVAFRQSWAALKRPGLTVSRKGWWRELVFRVLGQENEACFEELFEMFARADVWQIFPDVEDTCAKRGRAASTLASFPIGMSVCVCLLDELGLAKHFDSMTISCEVGVEKPNAEIFLAALRAAGVTASQAIHVGDCFEEDVRGAEAAGMKAILVDRRGRGR